MTGKFDRKVLPSVQKSSMTQSYSDERYASGILDHFDWHRNWPHLVYHHASNFCSPKMSRFDCVTGAHPLNRSFSRWCYIVKASPCCLHNQPGPRRRASPEGHPPPMQADGWRAQIGSRGMGKCSWSGHSLGDQRQTCKYDTSSPKGERWTNARVVHLPAAM